MRIAGMPRAGRGLLLAALVAVSLIRSGSGGATGDDVLHRRVLSELAGFTEWLERGDAKGYIGEVGWPSDAGDAAEWNELAQRWYERADEARLWVTYWATGEWWGTGYRLAPYVDRKPGAGLDSREPQSAVIEGHPSSAGLLRGVSVAGGEFGAPATDPVSSFSNAAPGRYGEDYGYDARPTFDYLARAGVKLVRIPFRWERLQPRLGAPLDPAELERLRGAVARARDAGLVVILDMHNYGGYYVGDGSRGIRRPIGSEWVPVDAFAEVWGRIALNFGGEPGIAGYGLMNEPVGLAARDGSSPAEVWEEASQAALDRIRLHGDDTTVLVSGYPWSAIRTWTEQHPHPWIEDSAGAFRYEAHHYWDGDASGSYESSYSEEAARASTTGMSAEAP